MNTFYNCISKKNKRILILIFVLFIHLGNLISQFAASNFTLLSNINPEVGVNGYGDKYSACWGWVQPGTNREYAIACSKSGTYWVDVTNPATPTVCAFALGTSTNGTWRETKTYQNYCYVVSDDGGTNTFQIFDMSTLPATVTMVHNSQSIFRRGHACWVDGNKLYVSSVTYSVGNSPAYSSMDLYSLATPSAPVLLRRLSQDFPGISVVHDMFVRNDTVFASCANQGLYVYKYNSIGNFFSQIGSLITYTASGYNHATSWTPNGQTLVMMDEVPDGLPIKIVNVSNISNMSVTATTNQYTATTPHNPWVVNNKYCFASSYQEGTQLYDISNPNAPFLAGYFDTYNQGGGNINNWGVDPYKGQWGLYAYFPSKNIFALDMSNGIFMLSTHLYANPEINLQGNANNIADGSVITNTNNNTNFGLIGVGSGTSQVFTIQNTGIGPLTVSSISITGANAADFTFIGPAYPYTIAPAGSQTFGILFNPMAAGTRSALVSINNNDLDEAIYDFVIGGTGFVTIGLKNLITSDNAIFIFPNPAQNQVQFNLPSIFEEKLIQIKIYNTEGKLVCEKNNADISCSNKQLRTVNVSELSNGLYYFSLSCNNKTIINNKLIINK